MAQILDINDLFDVLECLNLKGSVNKRWMSIGLALKLTKTSLDDLEQENYTLDRRLQEALSLWLKQCYDTLKHGLPTWEMLIEAVRNPIGGNFPSLADKIAEHRGQQQASQCIKSETSHLVEKRKRRKKRQKQVPSAADSCMGALNRLPTSLQAGAKCHSQAQALGNPANAFKILLLRLEVYLGAIFHGNPERNPHLKEFQTYKTRRHNSVLHIMDSSNLQFSASADSPDLILLCVPLLSDAETRRKECTCLRMLKHSYTDIWSRLVITITVPQMKDEVSLRKQEKRKKSLIEYMTCFHAPSIPSIVCISEQLIGPIPGDPEQQWYTDLWKAIFGACNKDNRLALMTYLSDRLTETPSIRCSPLQQKIPKEAADKAKSLAGGDYFEMVEKM